jgi:hypothetical protein
MRERTTPHGGDLAPIGVILDSARVLSTLNSAVPQKHLPRQNEKIARKPFDLRAGTTKQVIFLVAFTAFLFLCHDTSFLLVFGMTILV